MVGLSVMRRCRSRAHYNLIVIKPNQQHHFTATWTSISLHFKIIKEKTCMGKEKHFYLQQNLIVDNISSLDETTLKKREN